MPSEHEQFINPENSNLIDAARRELEPRGLVDEVINQLTSRPQSDLMKHAMQQIGTVNPLADNQAGGDAHRLLPPLELISTSKPSESLVAPGREGRPPNASSEMQECSNAEGKTESEKPMVTEASARNELTENQRKNLVDHFRKAFADGDVSESDYYGLLETLGTLQEQGGAEAVEKFVKDVSDGLSPGWKLECRPLPAHDIAKFDAEFKRIGATQRVYSSQTVLTYNGKQVGQAMSFAVYQ